jgi:hypothetical protein
LNGTDITVNSIGAVGRQRQHARAQRGKHDFIVPPSGRETLRRNFETQRRMGGKLDRTGGVAQW